MSDQPDDELARLHALRDQMHGVVKVQARQTVPYEPHPVPPPRSQPGSARFDLPQLARIPVEITPDAALTLLATGAQGNRFAQALSEALATIAEIEKVTISTYKKSEQFAVTQEERDLFSGAEPEMLLVTAVGYHPQWHHIWHINVADFVRLHPKTREPAVLAHEVAAQLMNEYPHTGKGA